MTYDLATILNDDAYSRFVRTIRNKVRGIRRRSLIAALHRAMQAAGVTSCTGIEVGVKYGTFSQQILESIPWVKQITLVDPWKEFKADHPDRGVFGYANRTQTSWDIMAKQCQERMQPFGKRARIMRETSLEAAASLKGSKFWFVYIDAGHSFEDVLADCLAWWPLVAPGGCLCGDDYQPKGHPQRTESVSSAVEAFEKRAHAKIIGLHRNFLIQKG